MNILESRNIIDEARRSKNVAHFQNVFPLVPSWEQFVNHTNYWFHHGDSDGESDEYCEVFRGVLHRKHFYFHVRDAVTELGLEFFPEAKEVVSEFNKIYEMPAEPGGTFVSLVGNDYIAYQHQDQWDSIFWQCSGQTVWHIFESMTSTTPFNIIEVNPGDVVVVPKGVVHEVHSPTPRTAIAIPYLYEVTNE